MAAPTIGSYPFLPQIIASPDVITSLTTFQLSMLKAYGALQPPALVQMGARDTTSALAYKFPVSVGSSLFRKMLGGTQYRRVGKLVLSVTTDAYSDGVMAEALDIQSDDWKGWGDQPASMALGANLIGERAIVTALEAGETTDSIENYIEGDTGATGIKFFGQGKACDPFGNSSAVYSNLLTSTGTSDLGNTDAAAPLTMSNIDRVWQHINTVKAQNGTDFEDLKWTKVLVPRALELKARRYFEDQGDANATIYEPTTGTADNKSAAGVDIFPKPNTSRKYGIQVISSPYLTSATTWYPICETSTMKSAPWLELTQVPARQVEFAGAMQPSPQNSNGAGDLQWVIDDYTSEGYKHGTESIPQGFVAVKAIKRVGAALLWPRMIFKCKAT